MKHKFLLLSLIFFGVLSAAAARADTSARGCETNTMKAGVFCNWAELKSWCNGNTLVCEVESTAACPANPTGGTYAFSCNVNTCVLTCNSGYTNCSGTCKLNVSVPSNCTSFNQCTEVCSACAQGYELIGGICVGATLRLSSDSVGASNYIFQSSSPSLYILASGNVGIGTSTPTAKLEILPSTGYSILAGNFKIGNVALPTADADVVTKGYIDSVLGTSSALYLPISGGTMTGAINMGNNNISNINTLTVSKLTATTIDPLYNIKGINYSTFAPSISGGVKEEYTGKIRVNKLNYAKEYEAVIDFSKIEEGSDLWVWRRVVDFHKESVDVVATPYGKFAQIYYLIDDDKIIFRSDRAVEISYRLTAKRFDWRDWPTRAKDQSVSGLKIAY